MENKEKEENIIDLRIKITECKISEEGIDNLEICDGICTLTHFKALLTGKRFADKIMLDAFMQRADIATEKYESIVTRQEYDIIGKVDEIVDALDEGAFSVFYKKLDEYNNLVGDKIVLYIQLSKLLQGLAFIEVGTENAYRSGNSVFIEAMRLTQVGYEGAESLLDRRITYVELALHIMITKSNMLLGHKRYTQNELEGEYQLWNKHYMSDTCEDKCALLCHWAVYFAEICQRSNLFCYLEDIAGKALKLLRDSRHTYMVRELLEIWIRVSDNEDRAMAIKVSKYIHRMYEELEIDKESVAWCVPFATNEIYPIDNIIRTRRKCKGLSQEQLAANICSGKTISNIERGKNSPKPREKKKLLQYLGIKYSEYGIVDTENVSLQREAIEWDKALNEYDYEVCKSKYTRLSKELEDTVVNTQYLKYRMIANENARRGVSDENAITDYINALQMTCRAWNKNKDWVYSCSEINILYNIGDLLFKKGDIKKAEQICNTILNFYEKQQLHIRHFTAGYALVESVYGSWYGSLGYMEKAYTMSSQHIKRELFYGGNGLVPIRLYDTGWDIEEKLKKSTEESTRYKEYAYALALITNRPIAKALENDITLQ